MKQFIASSLRLLSTGLSTALSTQAHAALDIACVNAATGAQAKIFSYSLRGGNPNGNGQTAIFRFNAGECQINAN